MNPLFTLGEEFRFHDSIRFRKKAGDVKLRFYHSFVPVLMSLAAESCRSRAESVHLLKPYLQWGKGWKSSNFVTPDDSARNRKMRKMMSLNCSICLMPIFGVGKVYRIWTPKGGPPQYHLTLIDSHWTGPPITFHFAFVVCVFGLFGCVCVCSVAFGVVCLFAVFLQWNRDGGWTMYRSHTSSLLWPTTNGGHLYALIS